MEAAAVVAARPSACIVPKREAPVFSKLTFYVIP